MAHREEDLQDTKPDEITVRLVDVEPMMGLTAACARLCVALPPEVLKTLPDNALDALGTIQSLLWGLEHARPESGA